MLFRISVIAIVFALFSNHGISSEITQFRGANGDGIAEGTGAPTQLSKDKNLTWQVAIPGKGWSSPVISDGKLWLTTAIEVFPTEEEREALLTKAGDDPKVFKMRGIAKAITLRLLKIDLSSGEIEDQVDLVHVNEPNPIHKTNSYASPTPVIAGDSIYCHFGTYGTYCVNRDDLSIKWERKIPLVHGVGPGSSPFVYKNLLVLICDGVDKQYVTSLNKDNGETVWSMDRPPMDVSDGDLKKSFDTPVAVVDRLGREQIICMGAHWVVAYAPEDGKEIWKVRHGKGFSVVPRPVLGNGMVYLSTGFGKAQLWAIRLDGSGDVTETHVAWTEKRNIPTKPSPLLIEDRIYVMGDTGIASCFDAIEGTTIWTERVGGNYSASPLYADGKIFFANHEGKVIVIEHADEYKEITQNSVGEQIMASPVAIDDALFIRTDKHLYRFESEQSNTKPAAVSQVEVSK